MSVNERARRRTRRTLKVVHHLGICRNARGKVFAFIHYYSGGRVVAYSKHAERLWVR